MLLFAAIQSLKSSPPKTEADADNFLNGLSLLVKKQLICALYLGREHIHENVLREDLDINLRYTNHIDSDDYARILYEKGESLSIYFDSILLCAKNSSFDLNSL